MTNYFLLFKIIFLFIILKFPYFFKILELMLYKFYTHLSWDCISSFEKKISSGIKKNLNFCLMALQQGVGIHLQFFFSLGCLLCKNTPWSCKKGQKSSGGIFGILCYNFMGYSCNYFVASHTVPWYWQAMISLQEMAEF